MLSVGRILMCTNVIHDKYNILLNYFMNLILNITDEKNVNV